MQNGVSNPELDYVYGKACNVNGFVNEEGSVDPLLSSLDLFKFFSSNCRALLVFYVVIYVQPSQKIHITKLREPKSLVSPNWMREIKEIYR